MNDEKSKYIYLPEAKKNSNLAAALHIKYKLRFCNLITAEAGVTEADRKEVKEENIRIYNEKVSKEDRLKIASWEHIRWQAYIRTEGYVHCPYEKIKMIYDSNNKTGDFQKAVKKTRDELREARIHPCIGDEETHLTKVSLLIGDPNDQYYFHKNDRNFADSIPEIIGGIFRIIPAEKE